MTALNPAENEELIRLIVQSMASMVGPTADMIRAKMAAEVDGLVDAQKKFSAAGWPEWMVNSIMLGLIRATPVGVGGPKA